MRDLDFADKRVVVIGSGAGMGKATALRYGELGAKVFVTDINGDDAAAVAETIGCTGGAAQAHQFDLRKRDEVEAMVAAAIDYLGGLDVLAIVGAIFQNSTVEEMTEEFWDNMFGVDLKGPLYTIKAALPHLQASKGNVVTVTTGAAFYPIPGLGAYGAAKAGLLALGRVFALEQSPTVRLNTVVPGPTQTEGVLNRPKPTKAVQSQRKAHDQSIFRWLDPKEIADVITWVSSDKASAVNGAIFRVDAGHYML